MQAVGQASAHDTATGRRQGEQAGEAVALTQLAIRLLVSLLPALAGVVGGLLQVGLLCCCQQRARPRRRCAGADTGQARLVQMPCQAAQPAAGRWEVHLVLLAWRRPLDVLAHAFRLALPAAPDAAAQLLQQDRGARGAALMLLLLQWLGPHRRC